MDVFNNTTKVVADDLTQRIDSVMTNFEQIFATYSPNTVRKVL